MTSRGAMAPALLRNRSMRIPGLLAAAALSLALPTRADEPRCALDFVDRATAPAAACRSCHGRHGEVFALSSTHPVDVDYATAAWSSRGERRLRRPSEVPADVVLVNGTVSCTTCHDARSTQPFRLARAGGRELCVACHVVGEDAPPTAIAGF